MAARLTPSSRAMEETVLSGRVSRLRAYLGVTSSSAASHRWTVQGPPKPAASTEVTRCWPEQLTGLSMQSHCSGPVARYVPSSGPETIIGSISPDVSV
jgi:hypothetical protein